MTEQEEIELERRERANIKRLNREFKSYCEAVERISKEKIKFDSPFTDIAFNGIINRNYVKLSPTINCLVSLTEWPVVLIDI